MYVYCLVSQLEPQLSYCVGFLEEVCRYCHCFCIPSVAVSLPMLGRHERDDETVELSMPASGRDLTLSEMLCQVYICPLSSLYVYNVFATYYFVATLYVSACIFHSCTTVLAVTISGKKTSNVLFHDSKKVLTCWHLSRHVLLWWMLLR